MKRYHRSYHDHYHYHSHSKSRRTSSDSKTDLRRTILYGSKSEISELLQRNKAEGKSFDDSSRHGRHPLHFLAERKVDEKTSNDFIEELFDLIINEIGDKVNVADNRGETPLHSAAENCNLSIAQKLISHKAEVNRKNNEGRTPLHFAAKHSKEDGIIEFLLDNGAHINAEDSAGKTPLHIAAFTFKSDLRLSKALQTLLNRGARVNIRDKKGFVPLFLAFRGNCLDNTGELLRHGADLNDSGVFSLLPRMHDSRVGILVFQHCVKLSDAGLPCNINFKNMMKAKHYNKCHESCVKEIEKLKETMIQERTSYYHFLHMDPNSRGAFINNEKLREFINDRDLRNKLFHQYAALIQASYYEAIERRQLLEPAKRVWSELTEIELPDICIERIFAYLSNTDLMDLIAGDDRCRRFQATDAYGNKYN